jgi:hypothetical protein
MERPKRGLSAYDLAATTRRRPSPRQRQYPVLPLSEDRLVQNNFNPRRADRDALDPVSHVLLGRRVLSQTARLAMLRDRLNAAKDPVVGATATPHLLNANIRD